MSPALPFSLSPHVCILPSPDLIQLLQSCSLPPLHHILQSFSPFTQVTTRTTSLTSVPHASFSLRFSDLAEIEIACKEGEDQRAARTIEWIGARITKRCAKWVEDMEKSENKDAQRSPWWDELRRCTEGDHVPSRSEGWNHPVAVILAVSTTAPNPLQALAALHSRPLDVPSWVDPTHLHYNLIVHPQNSPLSNEETVALFNAVKKQYGLHCHLLPLSFPPQPAPPVLIPVPIPRLPPATSDFSEGGNLRPPSPLSASAATPLNTLSLGEQGVQQIAKFAREFLVMSLIPWMEKCVVEWNENYSSTRRLPSRLFSSTRRLFGTPTPSPPPGITAVSATQPRQGAAQASGPVGPGPPSQQRRLAEFATILGDIKLAITVWETLRKEGRGGSDILPLLLAPSLAIPLHVSHALSTIHPPTSELPPLAQLRALTYAIRWELSVPSSDFMSQTLEGERWLVLAAGNVEEAPAALLLARAAFLSSRKSANKRATLWYFLAASRLEKCGIKPLTMFFLRRAHEQYHVKPEKGLSPSFWESEDRHAERSDDVAPGIEHSLGRLLYSSGDIGGAVRLFVGLLRGSSPSQPSLALQRLTNGVFPSAEMDKVYVEDFRIAFNHFKSTPEYNTSLDQLKLPLKFCMVRETRVYFPLVSAMDDLGHEWQKREEGWRVFWKTRGDEPLERFGRATVNETFWLHVVLRNSLDAEVNLSNLTVTVMQNGPEGYSSVNEFVDTEIIEDVHLDARETRTVAISLKSSRPVSLFFTELSYDFLGLLSSTESLGSRTRKSQGPASQNQGAMHASATFVNVDVEPVTHKLLAGFVDDGRLSLYQDECKEMKMWISNAGTSTINEVWLVAGPEDELWVGNDRMPIQDERSYEAFWSNNTLAPQGPYPLSLKGIPLNPGDTMDVSVVLRATNIALQHLCLLFVFRDTSGGSFHSARVSRLYYVEPMFQVSMNAEPDHSDQCSFRVMLDLENTSSSTAQVVQFVALSPTWQCKPLISNTLFSIASNQIARLFFTAVPSRNISAQSMITTEFVTSKLKELLRDHYVGRSEPPPLEVLCSNLSPHAASRYFMNDVVTRHLIHSARRSTVSRVTAASHPYIPSRSRRFMFPLYNPLSLDVVIFWEVDSPHRSGFSVATGLTLGAGHGALDEVIEEVGGSRAKRLMFAGAKRENTDMLDAIRTCEWNVETNPLHVTIEGGIKVEHDFSKGSCEIPVAFKLRNYSMTHPSRFLLRLKSDPTATPLHSDLPTAQYAGRLTFRGSIQPLQLTTISTKVRVSAPGAYSIGSWTLETEVGEPRLDEGQPWKIRHRYVQGPSLGNRSSVIVFDTSE